MPKDSRKIVRLKFAAIGFVLTFAAIGLLGFSPSYEKVLASASGPTESHTGAPGESNCTACHADFPVNSGSGSIQISGLPANYLPNQQIPVTVTVNDANAVVFGFQMTAIDSQGRGVGTYTLPAQTPQPLQTIPGNVGGFPRLYIEHTSNGITPTTFGTKSWTFTWNAPARRFGKVSFYAAGNAADSSGSPGGDLIYTGSRATLSGSAIANFDSDGKSDVSVFRPSTGVWYSLNSTDGNFQAVQFGANGDRVAAGDYDGDGRIDFAVWRPSTGVWYVLKSSGGFIIVQFGATGDIPAVGDYDGDLKSDLAVWRPSTGAWYILRSSDGAYDIRQFGVASDKVAQGDYDADGKTDIAIFRPSTGVWYVWKSSDNNFIITGFGLNGDRPVQGDYDSDGKTDIAVFRPSNGVWYVLRSRDGFTAVQFGIASDRPAPADFDGDGKTDVTVFRDGVWYILRSSDGGITVTSFGSVGDIPAPAGYIAE